MAPTVLFNPSPITTADPPVRQYIRVVTSGASALSSDGMPPKGSAHGVLLIGVLGQRTSRCAPGAMSIAHLGVERALCYRYS